MTPLSPSADRCPFCAIWAKEAPATVVQPSSYAEGCPGVMGIRPLDPVAPGHVIFIPREHVLDALENPAVTGGVFECASHYARRVSKAYGLSFNLITSAGAAATQTVMHLHVHVVPRREGDGLMLPWSGQVMDD